MDVNWTHKDLEVWQKALTLAERIYQSTKLFPDEERYGLSSQMRRAAVSIASNITEGAEIATRVLAVSPYRPRFAIRARYANDTGNTLGFCCPRNGIG